MSYADIYVKQPAAVPTREHWVILRASSVFIPGDERSRTNPGHGYPETTERFMSYDVYFDEAKFKEQLAKEKNAIGIHVDAVYAVRTVAEAVKL